MLPLTTGDAGIRPTVDAARKKLGGRASTEAGAGDVVAFADERGLARVGVVLFVRGEDLDVWIDGGLVRRVRRRETRSPDGAVPPALAAIAIDARRFADLAEGQRVLYRHEEAVGEGALVEKCRFGTLVERADGAVIAVGFRRVWAAADRDRN